MGDATRHFRSAIWLSALLLGLTTVGRASSVEVLQVDLPALIDQAADHAEQFAVNVPHVVSSNSAGVWTQNGATSTWQYAVQIPTAVSMSFHLIGTALTSTAVLTVTGTRNSITYRSGNLTQGQLWSRPMVGDTLELSLTVPTSERPKMQLQLDSVQAGYRGFGNVPNHPRFAQRKATSAASTSTQSCVENFSCDQTGANSGPARATVAVLIGNQFQCTGTLLNTTRNDFTPYILTARHCQQGALGGGAPNVASAISIYWNAVSACGTTLGSIYSGDAPVQYGGATTVVEQQDAWLIRLNDAPNFQDAYWAGWDATGSIFTGGYSIHHASGQNKQFVQWYGQALVQRIPAATLKVRYVSDFWGLVNQLGNVGAGASGGALFDPDNRVVGSATFASIQDGSGGVGVCPSTPPPVPSASTVTGQYTSFAAIFASTADTTSSTGTATMQSVLDSGHTNQLRMDGLAPLPVTLNVDNQIPYVWATPIISWNAPGAQSCAATGGVAGDGWTGALPPSGTRTLTGSTAGRFIYTVACTGPGLKGEAHIEIAWVDYTPTVSLGATTRPQTIGTTIYIYLATNIGPCTLSGGTTGDGWTGTVNGEGQIAVTPTQTGNIDYAVSCGSGAHIATAHAMVPVVPVSVTLQANATKVRVGSAVNFSWQTGGDGGQCARVGGSSTDGWAQPGALSSVSDGVATETTAGIYTYGVHCTSGGQSADVSISVEFTNDPPLVTLTAPSSTQTVYPSLPAQATPDLQWSSNIAPCSLSAVGPLGNTAVYLNGQYPAGTASDQQAVAGVYTYQLQCGDQTVSTSITWVNPHPTVTIATATNTWVANQPYSVDWFSNTTPCTASGGTPGDGWTANVLGGQGSNAVTESAAGTYTLTLACGTGVSTGSAQITVTVPAPSVSINASPSIVPQNAGTDISWTSTVAPCQLFDTTVNQFGTYVRPSDTLNVWQRQAGTLTYTLKCGTGAQTVMASTNVTVTAANNATTVASNVTRAVINTPVTLSWTSSGAAVCSAAGGNGSDGWTGNKDAVGSQTVTAPTIGSVTYVLNCGPTTSQTQVNYTAPGSTVDPGTVPSVTISVDKASQTTGSPITLTWNSQNADACTATDGANGDGWSGSLSLSGSMQLSESRIGAITYGISCTGAPPAASAGVTVTFSGVAAPAAESKGGGGALDTLTLLMMSGILGAGAMQRRRCMQSGHHRGHSLRR